MKSCVTCVFALDYAFSPACERCFRHSNWTAKPNAQPKPMTNADHVRSMSDEELAKEAADALSYCAPGSAGSEKCTSEMCVECWLNWLKQPYKEK